MVKKRGSKTIRQLELEIIDLQAKLSESEEIISAVLAGEADALTETGNSGIDLFTRQGADHPYRVIVEEMNEGALLLNCDGLILYSNKKFSGYLVTPLENIIGTNIQEWVPGDDHNKFENLLQTCSGQGNHCEIRFLRSDKTIIYASVALSMLATGEMRYCMIVSDVTLRREAEARISRLNRLYSTLSQISQAIVHIDDTYSLFCEICRTAVEYGHYRMAWIGIANESDNEVKPVAVAGFDNGYLEKVRIKYSDVVAGRGPTGTAIRENRCVICQDMETNPLMEKWREDALLRGFRSSATVSIRQGGKVIGAFTVYDSKSGTFDDEHVSLINEIGNDISYALDKIENEAERRSAEAALIDSEERFHLMFEKHNAIMLLVEPESGSIIDSNKSAQNFYGYSASTLENMSIHDINTLSPSEVMMYLKEAETEHINRFVFRHRLSNGEVRTVEVHSSPISVRGKTILFSIIHDVTEVKLMEDRLKRWARVFRHAQVGIVTSRSDGKHFDMVNPAFEMMHGYSSGELDGTPIAEVFAPESRHDFSEQSDIANKNGHHVFESKHIRRDGSIFPVLIDLTTVRDADGTFLYRIASVQDISTRKENEYRIGIKNADLMIINAVNEAANNGEFIQDIARSFVKAAHEPFNCLSAAIYLVSPDGKYLEMQSTTLQGSIISTIEKILGRPLPQVSLPFGTGGYFDKLLASQCGVILNDPDEIKVWMSQFAETIFLPDFLRINVRKLIPYIMKIIGLKSSIVLPFYSGGRIMGMMDIHSDKPFTSEHLDRLRVISRQITSVIMRRQAEYSQKLSEEKYRTLMESLDSAVGIMSASGKFEYMNWKMAYDTGGIPADFIGKTLSDIFPPFIVSRQMSLFDKVITNDKAFTFEEMLVLQGKERWHRTTIQPLHDYQGRADRVLINATDIHEFKIIQDELRELNQNLEERILERTAQVQDLYDNAPVGYHSLDTEGCFVSINQTELEWIGYSKEEMIGKHVSLILASGSLNVFNEALYELRTTGEIQRVEINVLCRDGNTFPAEVNAAAIIDKDGNFMGVRAVLQDITPRRKAEEAMSRALLEADKANRAKSEFLANMSHEIRTPMNAVLGYSELLAATPLNNKQSDYVDSIKSSGKSLLTIINDILDLSKIEAGMLDLEYDFIDTFSFFSEFGKIFKFNLTEKKLDFYLNIAPDTPKGLYLDESRLRQVLINLIGNAIKFTHEGYIKLDISAGKHNNNHFSSKDHVTSVDLLIRVEDTGIGMSDEVQESVFEPFTQAGLYKKYGGTGLGLPISRRLIQLMSGTLEIESEPGRGSTFIIRINNVQSVEDPGPEGSFDKSLPDRIVFEKAKILIIDDVDINRKFFSDVLQSSPLEVYEAENGKQGLDMAIMLKPNAIIADIRMPVMNGFEFLESLRSNPEISEIPVIACSASVMKSERDMITVKNFAGLLTKPVTLADLYAELIKFLPYKLNDNTINIAEKFSASVPDEMTDIADINDIDELIAILESDLTKTWEELCIRQPINKVISFGSNLAELGQSHNSDSLRKYGEALIAAADSFDVKSILDLIKEYPDLRVRLRKINEK